MTDLGKGMLGFLLLAAGICLLLFLPRKPGTGIQAPWRVTPPVPESSPTAFLPKLPLRGKPDAACTETYGRLYGKGTADFRVAFGYKDARPSRYVGDRYERLVLQSYLVAPCTEGRQACGFSVSPGDPDLLEKRLARKAGPVAVRLRLTHASLSPDDDRNRADVLQTGQSARARDNFVDGLKQADVVFYNGHSRDGGGPDFGPPRLDAHGHPDYAWYMKNRPGELLLLATLKGIGPSMPKLLGLFSCRSGDHFLEEVGRVTQHRTGTITTPRLFFYSDAIESLLVSLEAILGEWCEKEFKSALSPADGPSRARLNRFFR